MEPFEPVSEIEALTAQAKNLEAQLSAITKRLEALNKGEKA
jgi:prefoldin subunit 5